MTTFKSNGKYLYSEPGQVVMRIYRLEKNGKGPFMTGTLSKVLSPREVSEVMLSIYDMPSLPDILRKNNVNVEDRALFLCGCECLEDFNTWFGKYLNKILKHFNIFIYEVPKEFVIVDNESYQVVFRSDKILSKEQLSR